MGNVGWRNDNADCVVSVWKPLLLQTCMTHWNRIKPLSSPILTKGTITVVHLTCTRSMLYIFLYVEQTEISAFVFHKIHFGTTWDWVNEYIFWFVWTIPLKEDNVCQVTHKQVLTEGPVIPIPGSPFSPASPGTPGTPRSPWWRAKSSFIQTKLTPKLTKQSSSASL